MEPDLIYEFALREALLVSALSATQDSLTHAELCREGKGVCFRVNARSPQEAARRLSIRLIRIENHLARSQQAAPDPQAAATGGRRGEALLPQEDLSVAEVSKLEQARFLGCLLHGARERDKELRGYLPEAAGEQLAELEERMPAVLTQPFLKVIRGELEEKSVYVVPPQPEAAAERDLKLDTYWDYVTRHTELVHLFQWMTYSRLLKRAILDLSVKNRIVLPAADRQTCGLPSAPQLPAGLGSAVWSWREAGQLPPLAQTGEATGRSLGGLFFLALFLCAVARAVADMREDPDISQPTPLASEVLLSPEVFEVVIHQDLRREGSSRWMLRAPASPSKTRKWIEGLSGTKLRILLVELDNLHLADLGEEVEFGWADWLKEKPQADAALQRLSDQEGGPAFVGMGRIGENVFFVPCGPAEEEWAPFLEKLVCLWDGAFDAVFFLVKSEREISQKRLKRLKLRLADIPSAGA